MKNNNISNRKKQSMETKNKIYKSAEKLFSKYDFNKVSVDAIVKAAEVSKGTFYIYFDSKDTLIASLINDYVSNVDLDYKAYLDSIPPDMPSSDILLKLIGKIADVLIDTIGYDNMATIYKLQLAKTVDMEPIKGYSREIYKMFNNVLENGIQKDEFKTSVPLEILTKHFVMAIRGLTYEWCIRYPDFDLKEQSLIHFQLLLSGIKSKSIDNNIMFNFENN